MIDGNKITSLLAGTTVTHLSLMVKAGRVYKVKPPLYKIIKNGKEYFIKDTREYAEFVLNAIGEDINVKGITGKQKNQLTKNDVIDLIVNTKDYYKKLDKLSRRKLVEKELLEYIIMNIHYLREKEIEKFEKQMNKVFKQCKVKKKKKNKNNFTLSGIYKREAEFIKLNEDFFMDIAELEEFINLIPYTQYDVDGKQYQLAELLILFKSYEPKNKQRFKGKMLYINLFNCWENSLSKSAA